VNLFWHRRDLRLPDNKGLALSAREAPTLGVFVYDTDLLSSIGTRQRAFLLSGVRDLKERYRERGGDLLVRSGSPASVLTTLADHYDAEAVYYNRHYRPARRNREQRVEATLREHTDARTKALTDLVLVAPDTLAPRYENHSRFYEDWQVAHKADPYDPPAGDRLVDVDDGKVPPAADADADLPEAGYRAARERYDRFLDRGITTYNDTRDDLSRAVAAPTEAVSRMSAYLAAGMIGVRELWADATQRYEVTHGSDRRNVDKYRYELSWREQNYHLLYHNPDLLTENYVDFERPVEWRDDPEGVAAWKAGETGYPLVDAGMRQLEREGYVHNRPRQVVASFLTKHLLVDWRVGAAHFADRLVDHDPASNYGNWQWTASTGTDSVDVRIFDPVAQMAKYDADADYVTEYVPELRGVDAGTIVDWPTLSRAERESTAPDYHHPIVDRDEGYERAQRAFERALGKR
jgi:deoxyribodipyrimidine photo-lyase